MATKRQQPKVIAAAPLAHARGLDAGQASRARSAAAAAAHGIGI
jgi:hypothetical protein